MGDQFLEPKPFRGTPTEDPREWIEKVESWMGYKNYANFPDLGGIADEEEKKGIRSAMTVAKRRVPHVMGLLLQGAAGVWFSSLQAADKETFAAFKEKFKERYLDDKNNYTSLVNVWEEKQKPNETVDTYYDSHMKLVKLAGLATDANTNQAFVHGLLPHIKMQVMMQGKVELRELLEAARLAETAYGAAIGKTSTNETQAAATTTSKKAAKTEVSNIQDNTSDVKTIKVLKEILESVVGAAVGKITPSASSPSITQEPIPEGQKFESQLDSEQWEQRNALNWIGQSENKQPQPQQQRWQPQQQQTQPQQQQQTQPQQQQQSQPQLQQQQKWQPAQQGWQSQQQAQPQQPRWQNPQSSQQNQQQQNWQPRQQFQTPRTQQYGQQSGGGSCPNCGRYHPPGRANCGMADKTCNTCGKLGHSYRMCRSTNGQQQSRQNWQPRSSQGWQPRQQQPQDQARTSPRSPTDTGQM